MPNYKLSEYQVKKLWSKFNNDSFNADYINLNKLDLNIIGNNLVVKVDDGSKRRMKRGLVKLNKTKSQKRAGLRPTIRKCLFPVTRPTQKNEARLDFFSVESTENRQKYFIRSFFLTSNINKKK